MSLTVSSSNTSCLRSCFAPLTQWAEQNPRLCLITATALAAIGMTGLVAAYNMILFTASIITSTVTLPLSFTLFAAYAFSEPIIIAPPPSNPNVTRSFELEEKISRISQLAREDHYIEFDWSNPNDITGFFLNTYPSPIVLWGVRFASAEIAFRASLFRSTPCAQQILASFGACQNARDVLDVMHVSTSRFPDVHWGSDENELNAMREIVLAKFTQNPQLKELLMATQDAAIFNRTEHDSFWGDSGRDRGQNWLGKILSETRVALGGSPSLNYNQIHFRYLSNETGE